MTATRRLAVLVPALLALASTAWAAGPSPMNRYDESFRKYSKRFFGPAYDWRVFKAQAITESGLDPAATSAAGARGVMQLLPSTYRDVLSQNRDLGVIDDPDCNIAAGIYHDHQLWNGWAGMSDPHRQAFTLGSYNAGATTLLRAQRVAHDRELDERLWPSIEVVAPDVPRWRYSETLAYISRIRAILARMDPLGRVN
jgi:membrane-bound lytic murein transglycosylase MltF